MEVVVWIQVILVFKVVKEPIVNNSDTAMHVTPKALNSLVVDRTTCDHTPSVMPSSFKHMHCDKVVLSTMIGLDPRRESVKPDGRQEEVVDCV